MVTGAWACCAAAPTGSAIRTTSIARAPRDKTRLIVIVDASCFISINAHLRNTGHRLPRHTGRPTLVAPHWSPHTDRPTPATPRRKGLRASSTTASLHPFTHLHELSDARQT